jgi:RNA polymerase sigma factor (sigma-70 family)
VTDTERIDDAIDSLPIEMQTIIRMSYYDGYTRPEIADMTGFSERTINRRVRAALHALRKELAD